MYFTNSQQLPVSREPWREIDDACPQGGSDWAFGERRLPILPTNRLQYYGDLLETLFEHHEGMRIQEGRAISINRCFFVIQLDMAES